MFFSFFLSPSPSLFLSLSFFHYFFLPSFFRCFLSFFFPSCFLCSILSFFCLFFFIALPATGLIYLNFDFSWYPSMYFHYLVAVLNVVGSQIVHRPFEVGYSLLFTIALIGSFPVMCSVWTYTCTHLKTCVVPHCTGSKQCDKTFKRYSLEAAGFFLLAWWRGTDRLLFSFPDRMGHDLE